MSWFREWNWHATRDVVGACKESDIVTVNQGVVRTVIFPLTRHIISCYVAVSIILYNKVLLIFKPLLCLSNHSLEEQPSTSIHYQEKTTIIKTALKPRKEKDAYHLLDRPGQVVLTRLRSGHNRLNAHMHRKLKLVPSPQRVPVVRRTRQPSMFFRYVTDTNQSESHSGHQQLRFTRNYIGAWRTWRRPPTSSLLLDWSCKRTRRRRRFPRPFLTVTGYD